MLARTLTALLALSLAAALPQPQGSTAADGQESDGQPNEQASEGAAPQAQLVNNAAPAAAPVVNSGANADQSGLPTGITNFTPQPPSGVCKKFSNIKPAVGLQAKDGSKLCSSTTMGLIMAFNKMVSTVIIRPKVNECQNLDAQQNVTFEVDMVNMVTGFFNLANEQYYMAPQTLDAKTSTVEGHQHITVQKLDENLGSPPDPKIFAFFKGINNAATDAGKRRLQAVMPGGTIKEAGLYRICSMTGTDSHQPVLSPVIRRGPQEDCIRCRFVNTAGGANAKVAADTSVSKQVTKNDKKTAIKVSDVEKAK
ncbi:hypothetical protein HK105_209402 [Polyrhizophydium stewartii]|uniref:Uncharacterized protein n=1 Tax=Polyrhizophydium stewartii TaxID=2732419 RepID=A0ABR4MV79_9FUNG|nr:hypothetical protein HK105_000985 [Polyrhizophydium stewartii]